MKKYRRLLSLVLALVMAMGLCACSSTTESVGGNAPASGGNTPVQGSAGVDNSTRVVNLAVNSALSTLDPLGSNGAQDVISFKQFNDGLYARNEVTGEFEPRIAESWTISDDASVYTFKIRSDAKFHNGDPVKASDCLFSFERAMESARVGSYYAAVKSLEAPDDTTFIVTLNAPNAAFMTNINEFCYILSEREVTEAGEEFGRKIHTASCGPYKLTHLEGLDSYWEMEAFEDYYRGEASIKKLRFQMISDSAAGVIAFEAGELDWYTIPISAWDSISNNNNYNSETMAANHTTSFFINSSMGELTDQNLRKAILYAIDVAACNVVSHGGLAVEATGVYSPTYNSCVPVNTTYTYNPELAKEYLAKSSMPNGGKLSGKLLCEAGSIYEKIAVIIQQNLADIGLEVQLEALEGNTQMAIARDNQYFILVDGTPGRGDMDTIRNHYHSSSTVGYFKFNQTKAVDHTIIDNALDSAAALADQGARLKIYTEMYDYLIDCAVHLPMFYRPLAFAWQKDLNVPQNYPVNPQVYEWSWTA